MTSPRLYHISQDGEMLGEFTEEQARHYLADGSLHPDDIAWAPGLESWQTLQLLFLTPVESPPPLPQPSPPVNTLPRSKGPLTPSSPDIPTLSSIYSSTPPPLPHQRPQRTIITAQGTASPAPPPLHQRFRTNLPTPHLTSLSTPPPPTPATWLPPADPRFVPVHLRQRHRILQPLLITLLLLSLTAIAILLTAHITGHQQKLVEYLPALDPVFQWLTQNVPTTLPEEFQIPLTK